GVSARGAPFRGHVRCATAWFNPPTASAAVTCNCCECRPPGQQLQQRAVQATVELRQSSLFDACWAAGSPAAALAVAAVAAVAACSSVGGDGGVQQDDAPTSLAFWTDDRGASLSFGGPSLSQPHHHSQQVVSSQQHQPVILLTATRDHKLRLWDTDRRECYRLAYRIGRIRSSAESRPSASLVQPSVGGSGAPIGCLYANFTDSPCFLALEGHASADRRLQLRVSHVVLSPSRDLIDLAVEPDTAWASLRRPRRLLQPLRRPPATMPVDLRAAFGGREFAARICETSPATILRREFARRSSGPVGDAATAGDEAMDAASSATPWTLWLKDELAAAVDVSLFDDADADRLDERRACHVDRFYEQLLQLHSVDSAVCGIVADWRRSGFGTRDFLAAVSSCQQLLASLEPGQWTCVLGELLQLALSNALMLRWFANRGLPESPSQRRACHSLNDGGPLQSIAEPVSAFATLLTALESIDFLDDVDLTLLGQQSRVSCCWQSAASASSAAPVARGLASWELLANGLAQSVDSQLRLLVACLLLFSELPNRFVGLNDELKARSVDLLRSMALLRWCGALRGMRDEVNEANDEAWMDRVRQFWSGSAADSLCLLCSICWSAAAYRFRYFYCGLASWNTAVLLHWHVSGLGALRPGSAVRTARLSFLLNQPGLSDRSEAEAKAEAVDCRLRQSNVQPLCAGQPPPLYHPSFLQLTGLDSPSTQQQQQQQSHRSQSRTLSGPAYTAPLDAMLQLADPSVQLDCIRHLVVTLSDRDQLGALLQLNFGQLGNALVSVLEMRAERLTPICTCIITCSIAITPVGRILNVPHLLCTNCRPGCLESGPGSNPPQRQARALLAAIGCFEAAGAQAPVGGGAGRTCLKTGPTIECQQVLARVRVLTLADLEHRYAILSAHLQLSLRHPSATSTTASASAPQQPQHRCQFHARPRRTCRRLAVRRLLPRSQMPAAPAATGRRPRCWNFGGAAVTASGYVSTTEESFAAIKEALEEEGASAEGASPADCLWSLL
uniref:WD_REPEATS_REGION domain-containing protein n=1 Tax=Macrostomum lignano TaxID=282301 RepID=A0A1I8FHN7_9PLAT